MARAAEGEEAVKALKKGFLTCASPGTVITRYTKGAQNGPVMTLSYDDKEITIMMPHEQFSLALLERCPVECGVLVRDYSQERKKKGKR